MEKTKTGHFCNFRLVLKQYSTFRTTCS